MIRYYYDVFIIFYFSACSFLYTVITTFKKTMNKNELVDSVGLLSWTWSFNSFPRFRFPPGWKVGSIKRSRWLMARAGQRRGASHNFPSWPRAGRKARLRKRPSDELNLGFFFPHSPFVVCDFFSPPQTKTFPLKHYFLSLRRWFVTWRCIGTQRSRLQVRCYWKRVP